MVLANSDLPGRALRPSNTDNKVSVDTLVPVHGERAGIGVRGESSQVAVVVLDVVDAARAASDKVRLGFGLGLCHRDCHRTSGEQPDQSRGKLHHDRE